MENITNIEIMTHDDYFILNRETGKLELHFTKESYQALDEDVKRKIRSSFLWGRRAGCWISRSKEPNLHYAMRVAQELGLQDAGKIGERLSFAEQMERKAERAERRAERYEARSEAAEQRGNALQKPINDMRGDIAFFTQPNINTSGGRAFTRRREKMFAAFDRGFEEFRKSAYWQERANVARVTASQKGLQDRAFVCRRIAERESDIRKLQKLVTLYEGYVNTYDAGEIPKDKWGSNITMSAETCAEHAERYLSYLEAKLDELGFYQECLAKLGGVTYSQDNIKVGYVVQVQRWGRGEVISTGPKNCTVRIDNNRMTFPATVAYAEIEKIVKAREAQDEPQPFKVGESFTVTRWNSRKGNSEEVTYTIIRASDKTVTLKTGEEKPIVRKPTKVKWSRDIEWALRITDWHNGIVYRKAADQTDGE